MKRIEFYVLNTDQIEVRLNFICRMIETIYLKEVKLYVYCSNETLAQTIDEWLWTFDRESFVPHHLIGEGPTPPPPVRIGWNNPPSDDKSFVLLNLSDTLPDFVEKFQQVIEVIHADESVKILGRERYKHYKQMGYSIHTHPIDCETIGVSCERV